MSLIDHTTDRFHGEGIRPSQVPSEHIIVERRDLGRSAHGIHSALSFLSAYGVAPNIIIQAAAEAAATGIRPEQALLASGLLTEESYYRALARHLGLRLARFGFDTGALDASTYEEAPADLRRWMNQRRRWFKGWIQTLLVHGAHPMDSVRRVGVAHTAAALLIVAGTLTGALLGPFFAALALWDAFHGDFLAPATPTQLVISTLWCFVGLRGLASAFWPVLLGMKRRSLWRYLHLLLVSPVYWTLMTVAAWWAVLDFMRNPFNWLKTEHGLARNRRSPLPG